MNLTLFEKTDSPSPNIVIFEGERARDLFAGGTLSIGDQIRVGELGGKIGSGTIAEASEKRIVVQIQLREESEPHHPADLILALPRPQMLKRILANVAAMGVRRVALIGTTLTERSYFQSSVLRPDQLAYHLRLGLEQGMFTVPPQVTLHPNFRRFMDLELSSLMNEGERLFIADPKAPRALSDLAGAGAFQTRARILCAIGPESGFTGAEVDRFEQLGFQPFNIGRRVLRVETAVTTLLGQIDLLVRMNGCGSGM